jgi:hypothetical protein
VLGGAGVIKRAVSVVDTQCHAIDLGVIHPPGVYVALCGHVLLAALTSLGDFCWGLRACCASPSSRAARRCGGKTRSAAG